MRVLAAVLLSVVFWSCGHEKAVTQKGVANTAAVTAPPLSHNDALRFKYFYLEAVNQQQKGNFDAAFDLYRHCLTIDPNAAEVYFALAGYYGALDQDSMTVRYFKKAAELSPANNTYMERLAEVYINENRIDDAIESYESLYEQNKDRSDVLSMLFRLYEHKKDYPKMLSTLSRIEMVDGASERLSLARMNVYEQQGKQKEALAELKNLAQKHPYDMNYRVMMGNWLLQNGKSYEALLEYNKVLKEEPGNLAVRMSLLDYYRKQDKPSGIIDDPNLWSDDPKYIFNLIPRLIALSLRTLELVETLPDIG